ncbi:hypothetical protein [Polluticoccus soli]|uniref:hypothetical protein n=1 Tax=Polluticoccus soli TaxID=3034150 RepID=UPI0023E0B894|nr:hypothetical protein [Flavipsychrobacter sp. JY13-12]
MKTILFALALLGAGVSFAQVPAQQLTTPDLEKIASGIADEAMLLYRSEMASWYGTDIFMAKYDDKSKIGGYFSYPEGLITKCIFFSKAETPVVIGTVSFDTSYSLEQGFASLEERSFTPLEHEYYTLRKKAAEVLERDTNFKYYRGTQMNIVPLVDAKRKDVYVMTGTSEPGMLLLGNDYLIRFGDKYEVKSMQPMHKSLIQFKYPAEESNTMGQLHTHLPEFSPYITPTDICTVKLYEKITGQSQVSTVSEKYISIWSGKSLVIIPKDRIGK